MLSLEVWALERVTKYLLTPDWKGNPFRAILSYKKKSSWRPCFSDLHFFSPKTQLFLNPKYHLFKKIYLYFQALDWSVAESKALCESTAEADDQWLHSKAFPELATGFAAHLPQWVARHALGTFLQRDVVLQEVFGKCFRCLCWEKCFGTSLKDQKKWRHIPPLYPQKHNSSTGTRTWRFPGYTVFSCDCCMKIAMDCWDEKFPKQKTSIPFHYTRVGLLYLLILTKGKNIHWIKNEYTP